MSNFRIVTVATGDVARINRQGHFRQVSLQRDQPVVATGSIDHFRSGGSDGRLVLHRHPRNGEAHLQLNLLHRSRPAERCGLGTSGEHSEWVDVPLTAGVVALFEGDSNRDGRRDYLILLSDGAAILLERDARTSVCGLFGPPSADMD
jgi:hypothetical protein